MPWHRDLIQGERRGRGPHVTHKEKQTSRCLGSSWRRALGLPCPSASRKSEQTWPWERQHGGSDHGPTTSWGTPPTHCLASLGLGLWIPAAGIPMSCLTVLLWDHLCSKRQNYTVTREITPHRQILIILKAFPSAGDGGGLALRTPQGILWQSLDVSNSASARVNSDHSLEFSEPYLIIRSHKRDNTTSNLGCLEGSAELKDVQKTVLLH